MNYEQMQLLKSKFTLTVNEAVAFFGIGEKKMRGLIKQYDHLGLFIHNGVKCLVIREKFERFLEEVLEI